MVAKDHGARRPDCGTSALRTRLLAGGATVPATPERNVIFDINTFDETLPARWERDVKRLAASIVLAARSLDLSDSKGRDCAVAMTRTYRKQVRRYSGMNPLGVW
jgi:uncharacterized protein (DUF2252 family)